jgi:hypothetical protein
MVEVGEGRLDAFLVPATEIFFSNVHGATLPWLEGAHRLVKRQRGPVPPYRASPIEQLEDPRWRQVTAAALTP